MALSHEASSPQSSPTQITSLVKRACKKHKRSKSSPLLLTWKCGSSCSRKFLFGLGTSQQPNQKNRIRVILPPETHCMYLASTWNLTVLYCTLLYSDATVLTGLGGGRHLRVSVIARGLRVFLPRRALQTDHKVGKSTDLRRPNCKFKLEEWSKKGEKRVTM